MRHIIWLAAVSLTGCNWMWVEGSADDVCVSVPMKVQLSQAAIDASLSFSLPHLDLGEQKDFITSVQLYQAELDSDRPLSELGSIQKLSVVLDPKDDLPEVTLLDFDDPPSASTQLAVTQPPAEIAKYFVGGKATARLKVKGELAEGEWAPTVKACAQKLVRYEPGR